MRIVVREDGSIKESSSSTTIKKISLSGMGILVYLMTWVSNKIQELRAMYFLEDARIPSRESARPGRDRTPVTRGNPLINIGGHYIYGVEAHHPDVPSDRGWTIHLDDLSTFTITAQELFNKPPNPEPYLMPGGQVERDAMEAWKDKLELMKSLGYRVEERDSKIRPLFGPDWEGKTWGYLSGYSTDYAVDMDTIEFSHSKRVMTIPRLYRMLMRLQDRFVQRGDKNAPVPNDPAKDAMLSRLNRLESKRTNRDTGMDKDNSEDVYGEMFVPDKHGGIEQSLISRYEFDDPESLKADESVRHTGEQFGKGHVHPAYTVRMGRLMGVFKMEDKKDGSVEFKRVEPTIKVKLPNGDTRLKDHILDPSNYVAFMNAIRRELRHGNTPFIVQSYMGGGRYPRVHRVPVEKAEDGTPIYDDTNIRLPRRKGEIIEIKGWPCTRTKLRVKWIPKDDKETPRPKPCGNTTYFTHVHSIECTKCGGQLWRNKIIVFVPLHVKGKQISDGPGRYLIYDREVGGQYAAITLFGPVVGDVLTNIVHEEFDPSRIWYRTVLDNVQVRTKSGVVEQIVKRKAIIGIQRFWDAISPKPIGDTGTEPHMFSTGITDEYKPKKPTPGQPWTTVIKEARGYLYRAPKVNPDIEPNYGSDKGAVSDSVIEVSWPQIKGRPLKRIVKATLAHIGRMRRLAITRKYDILAERAEQEKLK